MMITGSVKVMNLFQVFRKKNHLDERKALYLFANGKTLLKSGKNQLIQFAVMICMLLDVLISDCYYKYKQEDGFVYLTLTDIATWG